MTYTRAEEFRVNTKRHPYLMEYKAFVNDKDLNALNIRILGDTGAYLSWAPNILRKSVVHAAGPYSFKSVQVDAGLYYTNNYNSGAFRGFGATQVCFGTEVFLNHIARGLGVDPYYFRMRYRLRLYKDALNGKSLTRH